MSYTPSQIVLYWLESPKNGCGENVRARVVPTAGMVLTSRRPVAPVEYWRLPASERRWRKLVRCSSWSKSQAAATEVMATTDDTGGSEDGSYSHLERLYRLAGFRLVPVHAFFYIGWRVRMRTFGAAFCRQCELFKRATVSHRSCGSSDCSCGTSSGYYQHMGEEPTCADYNLCTGSYELMERCAH